MLKIVCIVCTGIILLFSCRTRNSVNKELLASLIENFPISVKTYFSYPGRYTEPDKKKEVLTAILLLIRNAKFSIKIYAYSLNNPLIIAELVEANKRGVEIRIVGDKEQNYDLLQESGFVVNVWKQSGLHHIKVIVVDNQTLFTGTGNFSRHGLTNDWNGYIQFEIEKENRTSVDEFLEENLKDPVLFTNGIYFISSPENGFLSQSLLLEKIESAKLSIDYLIFDHFDSVLTHALKNATARGVQVSGVYDSPVDLEGAYLANQFYGVSSMVFKDGNEDIVETEKFPEGGLLHHKSMVIDGKTLLSGSYNFSANARDTNREILFMTENIHLVSEFQKEFYRVRDSSYPALKTNFYSFQNRKNLDSLNLKENTLCIPESINSPIIELGVGIFKTYLYYPKIQNSNCIVLSGYAGISSGISLSSKADFFSLDSLWNSYEVYDRNSNISYSYFGGKEYLPLTAKKIEHKNPDYLSFSSTRIYFEMKENLKIGGKPIHVWIPGKEFRSAKVIQPYPRELAYYADIPTSSSERGYAAVFIEAVDRTYYFCYKDNSRSEKVALEILSKRIFMKLKMETASQNSFQACIQN